MERIVYREMGPEDVAGALALRNGVFADHPVTATDWAGDGMLAAIAVAEGEVVGAIPLAMRELTIAPGLAIAAPFENSVGTRAPLRGRGVGAGMIAAARTFLGGRADGLFVYREGERTPGYRFYAKTGHHDLMATRSYRLAASAVGGGDEPAVLHGAEAIAAAATRLLPLFASAYGRFGGYPRRSEAFWRRALASSIFAELPTDVFLVQTLDDAVVAGYALVGIRTKHADGWVHVMELATRAADPALAQRTLSAVAVFAAARGLGVEMAVSDEDPTVPALRAAGFAAEPRGTFLMGQLLAPAAFFARHWRRRVPLGGVGLRVATELRDHLLAEPGAGFPTLTLEMKEGTLHHWLLARTDLAGRLREGTVTAYGAPDAILDGVASGIPRTPWAYHALDWI